MKKNILAAFLFIMLSMVTFSFPVCAAGYDDYYDADYDDDDDDDYNNCEHNWFRERKVVRKATPYRKGIITKECAECGKNFVIRTPKKKMTTSEKKAIKTVKRFFSAAKQYNTAKIQNCIIDKARLFSGKKYMAEICRKYNKKYLEYKIVNVRTKGSKIYVKVDVDYPDGTVVFSEAFACVEDDIYQHLWSNPNYDVPDSKMEWYIKQCVARYKIYTSSITKEFKLTKVKGEYKIEGFNRNINNANIINCGYSKAYDEYFE